MQIMKIIMLWKVPRYRPFVSKFDDGQLEFLDYANLSLPKFLTGTQTVCTPPSFHNTKTNNQIKFMCMNIKLRSARNFLPGVFRDVIFPAISRASRLYDFAAVFSDFGVIILPCKICLPI